ncbi:hypothetical protein GCM10007172_27620 [Sinomonas atrocyanea]|nr:hypothetical protein GCM10007172_27620 [Sinomonas atrocyanea]
MGLTLSRRPGREAAAWAARRRSPTVSGVASPTDVPFLTADSLGKEIAGEPLLEPVSFTVGAGECVAVEGPTGSGKTTLLRLSGTAIVMASHDAGLVAATAGATLTLADG